MRRLARLMAVLFMIGLVLGAGDAEAAQRPARRPIVVIVMGNQDYGSIIGSSDAPYINTSLLPQGALATNYSSITTAGQFSGASLPNHLALTGGSTFGTTTDCTNCFVSARNLLDNVEASGRTWAAYLESMPSPCFLGDAAPYVQRHDPFVYYDDIRTDRHRCDSSVVPYSQLGRDLSHKKNAPSLIWVVPNLCDDMSSCGLGTSSVAAGDMWLRTNLPAILSSPAVAGTDYWVVLTWGDGRTSNHVATIFLGPQIKSGYRSAGRYDHYSLLRTIEVSWGLPALTANDGWANWMSDLFTTFPPP